MSTEQATLEGTPLRDDHEEASEPDTGGTCPLCGQQYSGHLPWHLDGDCPAGGDPR